jgi:nucleotide-binding universal stress UspA family protein
MEGAIMYKKILVAYDGSSFSDAALHHGRDLARLCGAELHLVGIVATKAYVVSPEVFGAVDLWALNRVEVEHSLERAAVSLSGEGVEPCTHIREGNPVEEIANCSADLDVDLVIIGHSDKGLLARWFEGSVGAGLVRDLPCNLMIATR